MELYQHHLHHKEVLQMIKTLGHDHTEDYLCEELSSLTKDVIAMKGKIAYIENEIKNKANTDEVIYLKYDLIDFRVLLDTLLKKLKTADERYVFFKNQIHRNSDLNLY
jgi:hypothetical protein